MIVGLPLIKGTIHSNTKYIHHLLPTALWIQFLVTIPSNHETPERHQNLNLQMVGHF